ncbi:hypothetical protein PPROV_000821100 [Pycnococcus provasolii]|uniref:Uncharacterized protein n=1 Tax=Pycnococcus provasolii TaxID=41880 RepID=A0A830HPQ8_9CHLO|nr:hypothetical protein PPROV_000821100 [Pycnococcus provasolii]
MSLSSTWAEVSRLSSLVDPEHTPLRSKEISVDIIREALAARNVRSSDCKPSLINGEPHERVTTAILACKLGSLLTQCEALTEGAAFCRLGLGVLHSEIAMCAGDECREGAADVLRCHVNATEPALEAASCAGASHAELERNEEALQTLERAAQAAEAAEADQPAENTSREAAEAYACAAAASRQGGSRDAADSFTRRERRRWRDAARSSRALAEHLVVDGGGAPASSSASQSEAPTTIPSPMVSSSILVKDSQRIQSCAETRSAASAAVAAARAHHRCAEATERCADASSRQRQVYAHERCALELFKAACYGEDGVDGDVDDSLTEEQKERATTLFREEMNLAKEMAELLPMKVAQLKKRLD